MSEPDARSLEKIRESRRRAEERLGELRRSMDRELGRYAPKRAVWIVPAVAFACGIALAVALRQGDR